MANIDLFANNATLAATSTSGTTAPTAGSIETWSVASLTSIWPAVGSGYQMRIQDATGGATTAQQAEIILITASAGAGATSITVQRGAEGTTPVAHSTGATFINTVTAATLAGIRTQFLPTAIANQEYIVTDPSTVGVVIRAISGGTRNIFQVNDPTELPIMWVGPTGGMSLTDELKTQYSSITAGYGPAAFRADIYGYRWCGPMAEYSFAGPPGNMMTFNDSVHEVYGSRTLTVGTWGSSSATASLAATEQSQFTNPTTYRGTIRATNVNTVTGMLVSQLGGTSGVPVQSNNTYTALLNVKQYSAASNSAAYIYITWYDSSGTSLGTSVTGTSATITNSSWTTLTVSDTSPATAAYMGITLSVASAPGDIHDICGAGLWFLSSNTIFAPPFVAQPVGVASNGGAKVGDRYHRLDVAFTTQNVTYTCTTAGYPYQQVWSLDSTGGSTTTLGTVRM